MLAVEGGVIIFISPPHYYSRYLYLVLCNREVCEHIIIIAVLVNNAVMAHKFHLHGALKSYNIYTSVCELFKTVTRDYTFTNILWKCV